MRWYQSAILYEVYIRAFRDSNGDGHGDLPGMIEKLDYLRDLGVDCLWLLPFYPSPLVDDGYDVSDYYNIHPDYGTLADLKRLLDEAHRRGLRVIADIVLNHTSDQHPWFQSARAGPGAPFRDYYVWNDTPERYRDARIIFIDAESSNWTVDPISGQYFWHRFFSQQPDLNFDNPAVQKAMLDVMSFWLDLGLDGFRADAVPYLFEREDTNCENLPETHAYLKRIRKHLDERYPDAILLGEANQWPHEVVHYYGAGDEMHLNFHFPLMPRIFMALRSGDATPITDVLNQTPSIPSGTQWCTFLRNHDELTLEMVTPEDREWMWRAYAPEPRMRRNLGIRRRLAPLLDNDRRKVELAYSILFSLPGAPILYYGDEIGMGDNIWLPDRNGVRTPMQWTPEPPNAGFSDAPPERLFAPVIADATYGYPRVNVQSQLDEPGSLVNWLRQMIAVRKAHPVFALGSLEVIDLGDPSVLAFWRRDERESVLALHNLAASPQSITVPVTGPVSDMLNPSSEFSHIGDGLQIDLPAQGFRWLCYTAENSPGQDVLPEAKTSGVGAEGETVGKNP